MHLVLSSLTRGHRVLHRVSGGRLGRHFPGGQQIIWVSTLGRRSGEWRRTPLLTVPETGGDGHTYVVAGSNAGQEKVPGWVHNARAHPDGFAEVDGRTWTARVEEAEGADRDRLYAQLAVTWRSFEGYERQARRYIPVFRVRLLEPAPPAA
jgi:deazaflavin-dependent oxidoreductase (nitroreductase family)